jgi:4-hydroxy-tetrahydrodipicolinate synthase
MDHEQLMQKFQGIHAINVTPFREDGGIHYDYLEQNVEFLVNNGLEVIVPCGNTGEFHALSVEEAKAVTRFVVEKVDGRAAVLAGIGYDLKTAQEMASFAQDVGADAVMIHQPVHPYLMTEGLVRYYSEIARSVEVGVVLYVRHEAIDQEVLNRTTALDNVLAIKYAINDPPRFGSLVRSVENPVVWVCGTAEMWAPFFFAVGAEGFTSGLVNIAPEASLAMLKGLKEGNRELVQTIWQKVAPLEVLRAKHHNGNNVVVIKEGMNLIGLPAGRVREPISALDRADREELVRILEDMGIVTEANLHHLRHESRDDRAGVRAEVTSESHET